AMTTTRTHENVQRRVDEMMCEERCITDTMKDIRRRVFLRRRRDFVVNLHPKRFAENLHRDPLIFTEALLEWMSPITTVTTATEGTSFLSNPLLVGVDDAFFRDAARSLSEDDFLKLFFRALERTRGTVRFEIVFRAISIFSQASERTTKKATTTTTWIP